MYRTIVEERPENIAVMDVFSKLIQERIIFIDGAITEELANGVIAQMLYLDSLNNEQINIYINSHGGEVTQGLAIYDIAKLTKSPIRTVGIGNACSMGAVLMLVGEERCSLENCRFMLHQPSGGFVGTIAENKVALEEMIALEKILYKIIEDKTNITNAEENLLLDMWLSPEEALEKGIINKIL